MFRRLTTCHVDVSTISKKRSPFVKSSSGSSVGVKTVPIDAWKMCLPSAE